MVEVLREDQGSATPRLAIVLGTAALGGAVIGAVLGLTGAASLVDEPAVTADPAQASFYDCPEGVALGTLTRGDRVYLTGRDATGDWAEIRSPRDASARVWIRAGHVLPDGDTTGLPVFGCLVPAEAVSVAPAGTTTTTTTTTTTIATTTTTTTTTTATTTTTPGTTTTTTATTTTTSGTTTTTTTTTSGTTTTTTQPSGTTSPPDTTPPAVSNAAASPTQIWEEDGLGISCSAGTDRETTISANVTDGGGVSSVTAAWSDPDGAQSVAMSQSGSVYSAIIGPYDAGAWDPASLSPFDHDVTVTITARDAAGNESSTSVMFTVWEIGQCFG